MNTAFITEALAFAEGIIEEAGAIALRQFRRPLAVQNKDSDGRFDPVTAADREVETLLRSRIAARFPDHGIVGEEHGITSGASRYSWIIDPIDGTRAFISGVPAWGILLGLRDGANCVAGLVHQPYLEETFIAGPAGGCLRRRGTSTPLATRQSVCLRDAILYSTHPSMFASSEEFAAFEHVATQCRLMRYGGDCYSYCLLALGQVDLVIESGLQSYDVQPLIPLIRAAGGVISGRRGEDPSAGGFVIAAANAALHADVLAALNPDR